MTHIESQDDARFHEADGSHVAPQLRGETYDPRLRQDVMRGRDVEWNEAEKAAYNRHLLAHGSASMEPLTGSAFAFEHIALTLENDQFFSHQARVMGETPEHLAKWVEDLIYMPHRVFTTNPPSAERSGKIKNLRESFTREDFDGVDWDAMIKRLFTE